MKLDVTVLIETHNAITSANDSLKQCFRSEFILHAGRVLLGRVVSHFNDIADLKSLLKYQNFLPRYRLPVEVHF